MEGNITNITGGLPSEDVQIGNIIAKEAITFFRLCFYLVTPSETSFEKLEDVPNYLVQVVPIAPLVIIPEHIVLYYQKKNVPSFAETMTSIICLILIFLPGVVLAHFDMYIYTWLYERYNLIDLTRDSTLTWCIAVLLVDFGSFIWHKSAHEINFLWAFHQAHHTPQDFGLHAAFRLASFNRYAAMLFFLPMALVLPPSVFFVHYQLNAIFQLWIHSMVFPSLGPLDYIINNPSVHRVHHGRNRYCIDKNYGAVLSIWDVMFGTFEKERPDEEIFYGLVHPTRSFDVFYIQCHHFREMHRKFWSVEGIGNKLSVIFKGPGWFPGTPRLGILEDIPEVPTDKERYDTKPSHFHKAYVLVHVVSILYIYAMISRNREALPTIMVSVYCLYILVSALNMGYLLEKKSYIPTLEGLRCALYLLMEVAYKTLFPGGPISIYALRAIHLLSAVYWTFNRNIFAASKKELKGE